MRAGKATDLFPDSYRNDPIRPVRHNWPPREAVLSITSLGPPQSNKPSVPVNVIGTGFTPATLVLFNNAAVPSIYSSDTKITATFTRQNAGVFDVKARDGISDSNVMQFEFK